MTEGHPGFVAYNGRIGCGVDDYAAYAPETGADVRLHWIAVRRSEAHLSLARDLTEEEHYARRARRGRGRGLRDAAADSRPRPGRLPLPARAPVAVDATAWPSRSPPTSHAGRSCSSARWPRAHRAQQSIRTFFPIDHPERSYVKVALAIQNMGFLRGLSPAYMAATPAINDWVADVVNADETLAASGSRCCASTPRSAGPATSSTGWPTRRRTAR